MCYTFQQDKDNPNYVLVINQFGMLQGALWHEAAMVLVMMYENMLQIDAKSANELVYGYMLGKTHAMLFAEHYPKVEKITTADGATEISVVFPDGYKAQVTQAQGEEMGNDMLAEMRAKVAPPSSSGPDADPVSSAPLKA